MKQSIPIWTKKELHAYILIWCLNADFIKQEDEVELILSKIDTSTYKKMNKEFRHDNDYQSIEKIKMALSKYEYTSTELHQITNDMKELFLADGKFDSVEKNLNRALMRILS